MRIDDLNRPPAPASAEKADAAVQQRPGGSGKDAISRSDQADVSPLARALSTQDPGRIDQLRLQVQSGTYGVSADVVASSIIDAHIAE